jgi:hypothetical protein
LGACAVLCSFYQKGVTFLARELTSLRGHYKRNVLQVFEGALKVCRIFTRKVNLSSEILTLFFGMPKSGMMLQLVEAFESL